MPRLRARSEGPDVTYLPTDITSCRIAVQDGGCGQEHYVNDDHAIQCVSCSPFLVRWYGASHDPSRVAKTEQEEWEDKQLSEEGAKRAQEMAQAFAQIAAKNLVTADVASATTGRSRRA